MHPQRLPALTAIRFFAALWVVLFHATWIYVFPAPFQQIVARGYVGVDIFFILSGFILAYNYAPREFAKVSFWRARFARVWPVYAIGLAFTLPMFYKTIVSKHPHTALTIGVPVLLLLQSWAPGAAVAWNAPGWSLSTEAFFYASFPFLLRPLGNFFARRFWLSCAVAWILAAAPAALYAATGHDGFALPIIKFNPLVRLPEFALGIGLGHKYLAGARIKYPGAVAAASLLLLGAAAYFGDRLPFPMLHNGLLAPCSGLLLYSLACLAKSPGRFWILLGDASYSLYIFHDGILQYVLAARTRGLIPLRPQLLVAVYLVACIAVSIASFQFLELPAAAWIKRTWKPRSAPRLVADEELHALSPQ